MKKASIILAAMFIAATSCKQQAQPTISSQQTSAPTDSAKSLPAEQTAPISLDGIGQFVNWDFGAMTVTKQADGYLLAEKVGSLRLMLAPQPDGTYLETSEQHDMIGQSAHFSLRRVGDVITLTATDEGHLLFTMIASDNLKAYRDRGYKRMLTSNFDSSDDHTVKFTADRVTGLLPDGPEMNYFFIEGDNGDLSDKIRLSPGRFHFAFCPADKGVNLHPCSYLPDTGELEVNYDDDHTERLRYADDPGWVWLSTDVLDSGFLIYNFDKPYWELMLRLLSDKKQPNTIEQWNRQLLEALIKDQDPYSALESTDF